MTYITVSYLVVNLLHQSAECSCGNPQLFFSVRHSWGTSDSFFVFWIGTEDPTEALVLLGKPSTTGATVPQA